MDPKTKVTFKLSMGLNGCDQEETFTLEDLGYNPQIDTDTDKFLDESYREWKLDNTEGSWSLEGEKNEFIKTL